MIYIYLTNVVFSPFCKESYHFDCSIIKLKLQKCKGQYVYDDITLKNKNTFS